MKQDTQARLEALKRTEKALKEVGMFGALQQKTISGERPSTLHCPNYL